MKINLSNLESASPQQVFEQVATHLLTQKEKSIDGDGIKCLYRYNGLKCAAGCLIDDSEFEGYFDESDGMYGSSWDSLNKRGIVPEAHIELITRLQGIHDYQSPEIWRQRLIELAITYGFDVGFMDNIQ